MPVRGNVGSATKVATIVTVGIGVTVFSFALISARRLAPTVLLVHANVRIAVSTVSAPGFVDSPAVPAMSLVPGSALIKAAPSSAMSPVTVLHVTNRVTRPLAVVTHALGCVEKNVPTSAASVIEKR